MIRRNYFLCGTFIGLLVSYVVGFSIMGDHWHAMLGEGPKYIGAVPVFIGAASALFAGIYFDRMRDVNTFVKSGLFLPALIFLVGLVLGCLSNFVVNGQLQDFDSWFVKPFYWASIIGLPLSLLVGSAYYVLARRLGSKQKSDLLA